MTGQQRGFFRRWNLGAQAYGHGIYTAENLGVAESYRQKLAKAGNPLTKDKFGKFMEIVQKEFGGYYPTIKGIEYPTSAEIVDGIRVGLIKKGDVSDELFNYANQFLDEGSLYKVDLPDEQIAKMLDFDKQLSEQSAEVKNILLPYQKEIGGSFGTGEQTLKAIAFERRMKGLDDSPAAVAQQLRDMGIPGIKYLDQGSRNLANTWIVRHPQGGENVFTSKASAEAYLKRNPEETLIEPKRTRNFVTFPGEEKTLTILERNGQPVQQNSLNSFIQ